MSDFSFWDKQYLAGGGALQNNPGDPVLITSSVRGGDFREDLLEECGMDLINKSMLSSSVLLLGELPMESILPLRLTCLIQTLLFNWPSWFEAL